MEIYTTVCSRERGKSEVERDETLATYDQHTPDVCENENGCGENDEEDDAFIL